MDVRADTFRKVMGHFATGVTVITTISQDGTPYGLTANAFMSVSLEPPLLLISVDKKAESYPYFEQTRVFTINILRDDQEGLSRRFAVSGGNKFEGVAYHRGANDVPILDDTLAHVECRLYAAHDGGDHTLYLGEILEAETREGRPLLFYRWGYRAFSE